MTTPNRRREPDPGTGSASAPTPRAPLIVFCGIDGSVKSTLMDRLARCGRWDGVCCLTRENRENFYCLYALWPDGCTVRRRTAAAAWRTRCAGPPR